MRLHDVIVAGDSVDEMLEDLRELSGGYPVVIRPETGQVSLMLPTTDEEDAVFYASYEEFRDPDIAASAAGILHVRLEDPL